MKRADIHTEHINNLILSFLNRTISSTDLKVLKEWIDENEDNKAYFSEIQKIWLISTIQRPDRSKKPRTRHLYLTSKLESDFLYSGMYHYCILCRNRSNVLYWESKTLRSNTILFGRISTRIEIKTVSPGRNIGMAQCRFKTII